MAPHAHKQSLSFDPVIDTDEWRRAQAAHLDAVAAKIRAEHGALPDDEAAALAAKWDKQLAAIEAKFAEAEREA